MGHASYYIKRSFPPIYFYEVLRYHLLTVFQGDPRFDPLAGQFRCRMWFNLMPDSDIGVQRHPLRWLYDPNSTRFSISNSRGTRIRVMIRDMPTETMMVASDLVTTQIGHQAYVGVQGPGYVSVTGGHPYVFLFGNLENGNFFGSPRMTPWFMLLPIAQVRRESLSHSILSTNSQISGRLSSIDLISCRKLSFSPCALVKSAHVPPHLLFNRGLQKAATATETRHHR